MAAIDYVGIRSAIKSLIESYPGLADVRVYVEEEPQFGLSDVARAIAVFTDRRSAPASEQNLGAGKRTRYYLRTVFVVVFFTLESFEAACNGRDEVLANLELALMANRTLSGKVSSSWLEGGELFSARDSQTGCFISVAELILTSDVSAINT